MSNFESWQTALSINPATPEIIDKVRDAGITAVEVSASRKTASGVNWIELKRRFADAGVTVRSFHLPFGSQFYNIAHLDKEVREMSLTDAKYYMGKAAYLGARIIVIHPSSEPIEDGDRPAAMEYSAAGLRILADTAERLGMRIAVENLPRTCLCRDAKEMRAILDSDSRLGFCFDVNHLLCDTHANMIKACGDRLITLHISDYDFIDERHTLPGTGLIDFGKLIPMIEATGYDGAFTYEVSLGGSARGDYPVPPCTPADVAENKKTLRTVTGEGKRL